MRTSITTWSAALVAAVALCAAGVRAAERATFILTDGERISGTVVFHTEARTNIRADKNEFNVGLLDGTEVPIPFHQVAAIDFAGGRPTAEEWRQVRDDGDGHALVLRNGNVLEGTLVDLIGGDTVRWRQSDGTVSEIPIREARRIYLQPAAAATIFNLPRGTESRAQAGAADDVTMAPQGEGVLVNAATRWTDTGLTVRSGESLRFSTSGRIRFREGAGQTANVDGNAAVRNQNFPVASMPVGGLVARVGSSDPFPIGSNTNPIRMPQAGRLYLGVNDNEYADNAGAFRVEVLRRSAAGRWSDVTAGGGPPSQDVAGDERTLEIFGRTAWTDTGLTVVLGQPLTFEVSGTVAFRDGQWTDADGDSSLRSWQYPLANRAVGALIGRVDSGRPFLIGAGTNTINMPQSGRLRLGINDDAFNDNAGTFNVTIRGTDEDQWSGTSSTEDERIGVLGAIVVPAGTDWLDTGIRVQQGQVLSFDATGSVSVSPGAGNIVGPAGKTSVRSWRNPISTLPVGALIGRIDSGEPFAIGAEQSVVMPRTGRLLLGINDDDVADNSGAFRVYIRRGR